MFCMRVCMCRTDIRHTDGTRTASFLARTHIVQRAFFRVRMWIMHTATTKNKHKPQQQNSSLTCECQASSQIRM